MSTSPYVGRALPLTPDSFTAAASQFGCPAAALHAVDIVETGGAGGFLNDGSGRPRILFEAYHFGQATQHRFDRTYPTLSTSFPDWSLYKGGAAEYVRLDAAMELDRDAALASASWGRYQVLGSNAVSCGFASAADMVTRMADAEMQHLRAFYGFCKANRLLDALAALDWDRFARGYNGPLYAKNKYAERLASAYALASGAPAPAGVVRLGMQGAAVVALQKALVAGGEALQADGVFGRATEFAVMRAQAAAHLDADGVVGPATAHALRLENTHG